MSHPTIKDAEALVRKYGLAGVVIFSFNTQNYGYAEYGCNALNCRAMKSIADQLYRGYANGGIGPPENILKEAIPNRRIGNIPDDK